MSYYIEFTDLAKQDIIFHQKSGNKAVLNKLLSLLEDISEHPFSGTGKPEPLKYSLSGTWSRRINKEHRLVYEVKENVVFILSVKGHYL
ncbi:MAG: Txe/YoeB family addiction module toxin [Brumimicrobium sp.]|nr:Txe/YoeB family addiction module toxin [Brumimicrobium sp.]